MSKAMARDQNGFDPSPTAAVKAAWSREIERRLREIDDKTAELIDWEDIRAEFLTVD